jgi:hypothetical protein
LLIFEQQICPLLILQQWKIRCWFRETTTDFSDADKSTTENSLLILATKTPLLIVSNGFSVAEYIIFIKLIIFIYQNEF